MTLHLSSWAVGFFEAEGNFGATKRVRDNGYVNRVLILRASQKEYEPLERMVDAWTGTIRVDARGYFFWQLNGWNAYYLCERVIPYLSERRKSQADEYISVCHYREKTGPYKGKAKDPFEQLDTEMDRLSWAIGFFEGEGNFSTHAMRNGKRALTLRIEQKDPEPLKEVQTLWGGSIRTRTIKQTGKEYAQWNLQGGPALKVANTMRPYLSERRQMQLDAQLAKTPYGNPFSR